MDISNQVMSHTKHLCKQIGHRPAGSPENMEAVEYIEVKATRLRGYPAIQPVAPWAASDHYTFYSQGVPCLAFGTTGGKADHHHLPSDTLEKLSAEKLAEVVRFELELVEAIAAQPPEWSRG